MKKIFKLGIFAYLLCGIGMAFVSATPQIIYENKNFNLSSGGTYHVTALQSEYNNPHSYLVINSMTAGTKKNTFLISRLENGKYTVKSVLTKALTPYTCTDVDFGYVTHGNLSYSDLALDSATYFPWAGWEGSFKLDSR